MTFTINIYRPKTIIIIIKNNIMKKQQHKSFSKKLSLFILLYSMLMPITSFAWNGDILIHGTTPTASHSLTAKANGELYISVPVDSAGTYKVLIYQSTDDGDTWNLLPVSYNTSSANAIVKTKMVTTGSDSVYCMYQTNAEIKFLNPESGVQGLFNTIGVETFDAAASPNGNAIYLFVDEVAINSVKRYGTLDGGLTWGGNTATVSGTGAIPKVYMTGTRLILNYYSPVQSIPANSIIRSAFYDESAPGTITPGTFQDMVTNTAVEKREFQSVIYNNTVWFFYTEGNPAQILKCRVSTDNGVTYNPEFTVEGNASVSVLKIDAKHYNGVSGGCHLAYVADSLSLAALQDQVVIRSAAISTPATFGAAVAVNDFSLTNAPPYSNVSLMPFVNGSITDIGIAWVQTPSATAQLYFDRLSNITDITENDISKTLSIYPNPAGETLNIFSDKIDLSGKPIVVSNVDGKKALATNINSRHQINLSSLSSGMYFISLNINGRVVKRMFVKM